MKKLVMAGGLLAVICLGGCSGEETLPVSLETSLEATAVPSVSPSPALTPSPVPPPDLTGLALNPLTGLYIDAEAASRRPVAVVINNEKKALPQSGLSHGDLYYEVLAEGDITRIITVFQDLSPQKIGPIRSTRHYFLDFALDNDAVFVHHGGSPYGYDAIKSLKIENMDGMKLDGTIFVRDKERLKQKGMYEHSSFTSGENILLQWDKAGYEKERDENFPAPFRFYDSPAKPEGDPANKITVSYSKSNLCVFEYDPLTNLYGRSEFGAPQIDEETGEQLAVSNLLVQFAKIVHIKGDSAGRRDVTLVGGGEGLLFTGGSCVPVKWSKGDHYSPTEWTDANGDKLMVNKGKTWICVINNEPLIE